MKTESFNYELTQATALFLDVFNDITIHRSSGKAIKVKCLYGNRSRIFKSLENPERTPIQPPVIVVTRSGLTRDSARVTDLNSHLLTQVGSDYNKFPPNPIDLTFEMTVVTKYGQDMDRILGNFIPFANQSFFVKSPNPKVPGKTITHEVIWSGEISEEDNTEIDVDVAELRTATTDFTFKTWIWPGTTELEESGTGIIERINVTPGLCSLGVQQFLSKNELTDAESLCALSGFMLDDETYYGDIYGLCHWYAVPQLTSFEDYYDKIELGYVDPIFYDTLPIMAGTTGYVRDLDLGLAEGDMFNLDGEVMYFIDNEGGIVIYSDTNPASGPISMSATCMPSGISEYTAP